MIEVGDMVYARGKKVAVKGIIKTPLITWYNIGTCHTLARFLKPIYRNGVKVRV